MQSGKAIPEDLRDVGDLLLQAIADVHADTVEPGRGSTLANLSRAYISVFQVGDVQRRLAEIEDPIGQKERASRAGAN